MNTLKTVFAVYILFRPLWTLNCELAEAESEESKAVESILQTLRKKKLNKEPEASWDGDKFPAFAEAVRSICPQSKWTPDLFVSNQKSSKLILARESHATVYSGVINDEKKAVRVFSFASIILELACPDLLNDQASFDHHLNAVESAVEKWYSQLGKEETPNGVPDISNDRIITNLAKALREDITAITSPEEELKAHIASSLQEITSNIDNLFEVSSYSKEGKRMRITESIQKCRFTKQLRFILISTPNGPSLSQVESVCQKGFYKYDLQKKLEFAMTLMYPVYRLHQGNKVHCKLGPWAFAFADESMTRFNLVNFSESAIKQASCSDEINIMVRQDASVTMDEANIETSSTGVSQKFDVFTLGKNLLLWTMEADDLIKFGFPKNQDLECVFNEDINWEKYWKMLKKLIHNRLKSNFKQRGFNMAQTIGQEYVISLFLMLGFEYINQPTIEKVLYHVLRLWEVRVDPSTTEENLENLGMFLYLHDTSKLNEDVDDPNWITRVEDIITSVGQPEEKKRKLRSDFGSLLEMEEIPDGRLRKKQKMDELI